MALEKKYKKEIGRILDVIATTDDAAFIEIFMTEKLKVDQKDVKRIIDLCRRKIRLAADFDAEEALGRGLTRLNLLYEKCVKVQDFKTALGVQKELNKLQAIYQKRKEEEEPTIRAEIVDETGEKVREILESIKPDGIPANAPLTELAKAIVRRQMEIEKCQLLATKRPSYALENGK